LKILVISANYPSEANKHTFGFVHARVKLYRKYGHKVYVLVPLYKNTKEAVYTYTYEGVKVSRVHVNYIGDIVNIIDPDVIAYHYPEPSVLAKLLLARKPLVLWIQGADVLITFLHNYYIPFYMRSLLHGLLSIPRDVIRNLSLRKLILEHKSVEIVTLSVWMKKKLLQYLALPSSYHARIHIIPNPVDTDKFKPIKSCYERQRNVGISVRALGYKYGVDIAVKAMCGLKDVELIIVGNGPLREFLKNIAEKCKANVRFIYHGVYHEELPRYYNEVGFFVAPSRAETQGVAMCEALASGTPTIATNVGGIPEFVIHGYNGFIVKPHPDALRRAILAMVKLPVEDYCAMSQNAVSYAKATYSHEVIIPKDLELFSRAIELYNKKSSSQS